MNPRNRRRFPARPAILGAIAFLAPRPASPAEGPDAHGFNLVAFDAQPVGFLSVQDPFLVKGFFGGGLFEYATETFVRGVVPDNATPDELSLVTWEPVLDNIAALNLNAGYSFNRYLRLDVGAPIYLTSTGVNGESNGASFGDVRVSAFGGFATEENAGVGVGLVPFLDIPSGDAAAFLGQGGLAGGAKFVLGYRSDRLLVSADAGAYVTPDLTLDNLSGADVAQVGAGLGYAATERLGLNLETHLALPLESQVAWAESPAELLGHATYQFPAGIALTAGGAAGLSQGVGTAQYRVFLGFGYGPVFKKAPPVVLDLDADDDGILDTSDACSSEPETINAFKDADGCPDALSSITAVATVDGEKVTTATIVLAGEGGRQREGTDSVTIENAIPGSNWKASARHLCHAGENTMTVGENAGTLEVILSPKLDAKAAIEFVYASGKPVPNAVVKWDKESGRGCVPKGIATKLASGKGEIDVGVGKYRVFITADGANTFTEEFEFTAGQSTPIRAVLANTRVKMEAKQIVILDKVFFETGKDIIKADSFRLLDEVAATIMANPQIGRVAIEGHTDSDGDEATNLELSTRRAESVKRYIEGKGVRPQRLVANGYGESKPIAKNTSSAGKATNRRVEFNLLDQAAPTVETPAIPASLVVPATPAAPVAPATPAAPAPQ